MYFILYTLYLLALLLAAVGVQRGAQDYILHYTYCTLYYTVLCITLYYTTLVCRQLAATLKCRSASAGSAVAVRPSAAGPRRAASFASANSEGRAQPPAVR